VIICTLKWISRIFLLLLLTFFPVTFLNVCAIHCIWNSIYTDCLMKLWGGMNALTVQHNCINNVMRIMFNWISLFILILYIQIGNAGEKAFCCYICLSESIHLLYAYLDWLSLCLSFYSSICFFQSQTIYLLHAIQVCLSIYHSICCFISVCRNYPFSTSCSLSVCPKLSVILEFYHSVYHSIILPFHLLFYSSTVLSETIQPLHALNSLPACLSIFLSVSNYPSTTCVNCLSICLSVCLSLCLQLSIHCMP